VQARSCQPPTALLSAHHHSMPSPLPCTCRAAVCQSYQWAAGAGGAWAGGWAGKNQAGLL